MLERKHCLPLNIPTAAAVWVLEWEQGDTGLALLELSLTLGGGGVQTAGTAATARRKRGKDGQQEDGECS